MSTQNSQQIERIDAEAFAERLVGMLNDSALFLMTSIGHRTGLFDTMARLKPSTSEQIATASGLNERYVREWLGAMTTGGFILYDPEARTYRLPPEHAACLTRAAAPGNLAQFAQWVAVLGAVEDEVVDAFRHGKGVPYSAYDRFNEVMAETSAQTVVAGLDAHIIPLIPGLKERLTEGIEVLDVGCGSGLAMIALAAEYPNSRFTGYDFLQDAVDTARAEAERRGLTNVSFEVQDVAEISNGRSFDMITAFDSIHDQARPAEVLSGINRALAPDGTFLMQDILASSHVQNNIGNPVAPFVYTVSCMHCMSVSLACDGAGLGAAWGREKAVEMLGDAGFGDVRIEQLANDFMNYWYVARR